MVSKAKADEARGAAKTRRFEPVAAQVFSGDWARELTVQISAADEAARKDWRPFRIKNAPELLFSAEAEGSRWYIRCNLISGEVIARETGQRAAFVERTAGMITRLHKAHGYPNQTGITIRWWWALLVEVMSFLMVLWGLSGLAMWWQMRGQRKWGAIALAACGVVTWLVWTGMQAALR